MRCQRSRCDASSVNVVGAIRDDHHDLDTEDARGNRTIAIGPATAAALRAWQRQQSADHLLAGASWADRSGFVVTNVNGSLPNPEAFSNLFVDLAKRAGLPQIRLHDPTTATQPPHSPAACR